MHIHTVKKGETVYSIANQYGVSPSKIIENNGLDNKNNLSVGRELLILTPTRTYTVKSGDTLAGIAMRFGIKKRELLRSNPSHTVQEKVMAGELLAIKNESERYGTSVANGYFYHGCTIEKLKNALPYLTYVTVASVINTEKGLKTIFDDKKIIEHINQNGKIPLLRIYDTSDGAYVTDKSVAEEFSEKMIKHAKSKGYLGIVLSAFRATEKDAGAFGEFIISLRKKMIGSDLVLFTEIDETSPSTAADYADGNILTYDKISCKNIPSFENGEKKVFTDFANKCESTKVFIEIPSLAFSTDKYLALDEVYKKAWDRGLEIKQDEERLISYIQDGSSTVIFESMTNLAKKLELISELGYMGISFDIMRVPISALMMYNCFFKTVSFSGHYYFES